MKKGSLSNLILILAFLAGLSLLLYPTVSDYWNSLHQSQVIVDYARQVEQMEQEKYERLWNEAQDYNRRLANGSASHETLLEEYPTLLDPSGNGVMGYLEIPSINCTLPIGHGTGDGVLRNSVGHLDWTSLPVGGQGSHCVLSGHRGLPSAELLTNIDHLEPGDLFYIHTLDRVLQYRVDNIWIVEPTDSSRLQIIPGGDYVTLLTCTPYGINSHRLLVRGVRVAEGDSLLQSQLHIPNEGEEIELTFLVPMGLLVLVTIAFVALLFRRPAKAVPAPPETHSEDEEENE